MFKITYTLKTHIFIVAPLNWFSKLESRKLFNHYDCPIFNWRKAFCYVCISGVAPPRGIYNLLFVKLLFSSFNSSESPKTTRRLSRFSSSLNSVHNTKTDFKTYKVRTHLFTVQILCIR